MDVFQETVKKIIEFAGFRDYSLDFDSENRRLAVFINEGDWFKKIIPNFVNDVDYVLRLVAKRNNLPTIVFDVNNYRREREHLIVELAQAAARKALLNKAEVELPAMNGYERRLIHLELATRPDVKTESVGIGKDRKVVVKPI